MDRSIRYAAYIANIALLLAVGFIVANAYAQEVYIALLFTIPPVLSMVALYTGPDREERYLTRQLNKARMRRELKDLKSAATKPSRP